MTGFYPQSYPLVVSRSEIHAIDLLTHDRTGVISELKDSKAIALDMVDMKLYFDYNGNISMANLDGSDVEVIIKKANPNKMAIDWIGRRIFWTHNAPYGISVADLNGSNRYWLIKLSSWANGIAIDPVKG